MALLDFVWLKQSPRRGLSSKHVDALEQHFDDYVTVVVDHVRQRTVWVGAYGYHSAPALIAMILCCGGITLAPAPVTHRKSMRAKKKPARAGLCAVLEI